MRLSRTDLVPVLAIVAGGVIGASLSFSFFGSRSDDVVFVAVPVVNSYESIERAEVRRSKQEEALARARALAAGTRRIEVERRRIEVERRRIEVDRVEISPSSQSFWIVQERLDEAVESTRARLEEAQRLLERDRVERIEETLESVRGRVEELQRVLERVQEGSAH